MPGQPCTPLAPHFPTLNWTALVPSYGAPRGSPKARSSISMPVLNSLLAIFVSGSPRIHLHSQQRLTAAWAGTSTLLFTGSKDCPRLRGRLQPARHPPLWTAQLSSRHPLTVLRYPTSQKASVYVLSDDKITSAFFFSFFLLFFPPFFVGWGSGRQPLQTCKRFSQESAGLEQAAGSCCAETDFCCHLVAFQEHLEM